VVNIIRCSFRDSSCAASALYSNGSSLNHRTTCGIGSSFCCGSCFYARLVDSSFVNLISAMKRSCNGASPFQIVRTFLLPNLCRAFCADLPSRQSALSDIQPWRECRRRGVGDLAIRFGYYRYQTNVMMSTVVALMYLFSLFQMFGITCAQSRQGGINYERKKYWRRA